MENTRLFNRLTNADFRFSVLLIAVLFTLPLGWQAVTNSLLLVVLLHSLMCLKLRDWKAAFLSPIVWFSSAFFLFNVFSLLWVDDVDDGLVQMETKLTFILGPLLIVAATKRYISGFRDMALKAFLYGNVLVSIAALGYAVYRTVQTGMSFYLVNDGATQVSYFTYTVLSEPFMHPGYLSTYLGFGIFIAIYFLAKKGEGKRVLYGGLLAFFFVMIVLLQGRINVLALIAVLGLGALIYAVKLKAYKVLLLPIIPVLLLVGFMLFGSTDMKSRYFQLPDFKYDISGNEFNSATYRLAEWKCAAEVIEQHVWVGTGMGDNREALTKSYEKNKFWQGIERNFNAHNQYLETMISVGLVGLVLLLMLFGYYGRTAYQQKDYLALSCLLFFALCMLTESMMERAWAVLLFTSYFPLLLTLGTKSKA